MSIAVSSQVWEYSRQKSGNLLVLLAIADHADERGIAWPGIPLLARKTRLSERHVRRCLISLAVADELETFPNASPIGGPLYRIRLEHLADFRTAKPTQLTPVSGSEDVDVTPSIREPSEETSLETDSSMPGRFQRGNISLRPKLDEVLRFASQEKHMDPAIAETWWHDYRACGWIDSHGRSIIEWQSALIAYTRKWEANRFRQIHPASPPDSARKNNPRRPTPQPAKVSTALKNGF